MTHTLNFFLEVKKSKELQQRLINNFTDKNENSITAGDFTMSFDFEGETAKIFCNNPNYSFIHKCMELEYGINELEEFVKELYGDKI